MKAIVYYLLVHGSSAVQISNLQQSEITSDSEQKLSASLSLD